MPSGDIGFVILLVIHITSFTAWVGSAIVLVFSIQPSISIEKARDLLVSALPGFSKLVRYSSGSTLISGLVLLGYVDTVDTSLFPTGLGLLLLISGAVLGLVAFMVATTVIVPSSNKLIGIFSSDSVGSVEQFNKSMDTIRSGSRGVLALLFLVLILMVSGTYL
jgi:uncharacterized membrane protein